MSLESTCELIDSLDIKLPGVVVKVKVYKTPESRIVEVQYIGKASKEIKETVESFLRNSGAESMYSHSGTRN